MARINVFLKDEFLKAVDAEVKESGISRSGFIQAALESHLQARRRAREEAEAQRRMDEACRRMDALAEKLGRWDPVRVIREARNTRYGPPREGRRRARAGKRQ